MESKQCIKCNEIKDLSEFSFRKDTGKYRNECKLCVKNRRQIYYSENKETIREQVRLKNKANPEPNRKRVREWKENNPEKYIDLKEREKQKNREIQNIKDQERIRLKQIELEKELSLTSKICISCGEEKSIDHFYFRKDSKKYKNECLECFKIRCDIYNKTHREEIATWHKQYGRKYRKTYKLRRKIITKERLERDPNFKLALLLRSRISNVLRGKIKGGSAIRDLGCSINDLRLYLESKFYPHPKTGEMMSWKNWSKYGWHVDHIKPLASFNLADREQFLQACHYTNLQPLWAEENLSKGAKII